MLFRILTLVFCFSLSPSYGQLFNKFKWKHLGPFTTPTTTADFGKWTATGQGWIEDILITEKYWYAGAMTGGVYRSRNEGKTWRKIDQDSVQLGTLCLHEKDNIIYRGAGRTHHGQDFGTGILQSKDNGRTWSPTGLSFKNEEGKIVWQITSNERNMLAITDNELWMSETNNADSWKKIFSIKEGAFRSVHIDREDPNHILLGGKELHESYDGGKSFSNVTKKLSLPASNETKLERIALAQDPSNSRRWLAFYGGPRKGYVDESTDNGITWKNIFADRNVARADKNHTEIAFVPGKPEIVILGTYRAYISRDSGKTYKVSTMPIRGKNTFAHDDIRGITTLSNGKIYLATDGGVFESKDLGVSWLNRTGKGLVVNQAYGLHVLPNNDLVMGCQDLGYMVYRDKEWSHIGRHYGDGGDAISMDDGLYLIVGGRIRKTDTISSRSYMNAHPNVRGNPFVAFFEPHPSDSNKFFYIGNRVWKYNGKKWIHLSKGIDGDDHPITGFDINKKNPNQLFFSFDQPTWGSANLKGKFFRSTDGGESWQDITANLSITAWHHVSGIESNPDNPKEVYVSLGRIDTDQLHKVYKSTDGGDTWINFSEGLPKYETLKISFIPNTDVLVMSTIAGFYYRSTRMNSWEPLSGKIPNIETRDFEISPDGKHLYAATYGNGVWRLKIPKKWYKSSF